MDTQYYELVTGESIEFEILSAADWSRLFELGEPVRLPLMERYGLTVYALSDGRALGSGGDHYLLYPSVAALERIAADLDLDGGASNRHLLFRRNPYGADFPAYTGELIEALCAEL